MQFIDLKSQQKRIREKIDHRIATVLEHGNYIMGPEIAELEAKLAEYVGVKHCIGAASGTDTLLIAMMALGISMDDEVITVPYTWISTAEMITLLRAKPIFVDIDPNSWNLDPAKLEAAITSRTKAIMPVGIFGQVADMESINAIAARHNLPVIEDAAQSFGALHHGRRSCALSTIGSTSFFPTKPLGCYGDGGALFTNDDQLAETMRQIRVHGQARKHYHPILGINGRLDTLQAAILLEKLEIFDDEIAKRQRVAATYNEKLGNLGVTLPRVAYGNTSVYAQYTVLSPRRDEISAALTKLGVPSVSYYAVPLHRQPVFAYLGRQAGEFPCAEKVSNEGLSLPMNPYLTDQEVDLVCSAFATVLKQY